MNMRYIQLPEEAKAKISEEEFNKFSMHFQYAILKECQVDGDYMLYDKLRVDVRKHISEDVYALMPEYIKERLATSKTLLEAQIIALSKLPWENLREGKPDVSVERAMQILNQTHLGLNHIKNRVLRYIACQKRIGSSYGTVLLFCGPPGVGKTSIAQSIANAMHRPMVKISLAGVTEGAVLKGTSTIYSNSRPGRVIDAIINSRSFAPVIVLDEIDKISNQTHGANPQYALLDLLDSDRSEYVDECLGIPLNLENVIFIATANNIEDISPILLDRFDVVQLAGYTETEKYSIAKDYLLKNLYQYYSLEPSEIQLEKEAILFIIREFSKEAGVRKLNHTLRQILEEAVYCKEIGQEYEKYWGVKEVKEFFDLR